MGGNLKNAVLAILTPLPSIVFYVSFLKHYEEIANAGGDGSFAASIWTWCYYHPVLLANLLFFFNVNVLFWVISHIQHSHWVSYLLS